MFSFYALLLVTLWSDTVHSEARFLFNVVGMFEHNTYNSTTDEDYAAPDIFQTAIDYTRHEQYIEDLGVSLDSKVYHIYNHDAFGLAQYVCKQALTDVKMGASLGVQTDSLREYMQIVSNKKYIPYFEISPSTPTPGRPMVTHMHPNTDELVAMLRLLINSNHPDWNWDKAFIVYESSPALTGYLELLALHKKDDLLIRSFQKETGMNFSAALEYIVDIAYKKIIVDCSLSSVPILLDKALEMQMLTEDYHYHFTSLDLHALDLSHFSYGGAKITWTQLVNKVSETDMSPGVTNYDAFLRLRGHWPPPRHYFTTHNAMLVDAMMILAKAVDAAIKQNNNFTTKSMECYDKLDRWDDGQLLNKFIRNRTEDKGMTGKIQFSSEGTRINYAMHIMKLQRGGAIENIGNYTPPIKKSMLGDLHLFRTSGEEPVTREMFDSFKHLTLNITTVLEPPYLIQKSNPNGETMKENNMFEGYVVDLMERIAEEAKESHDIDLKYRFIPVADQEYGVEDPKTGEWNGMVRELLDRKADMAVAPLTINYERERVVDFTKPFMTFGIAILYKLPEQEPPHMLSFMEPINLQVWGTIIVSVVFVSYSMYIFSRFSPTEWENPYPCQENNDYLENQFNLANAFWFAVGSIVQQGCDIMPKAPSTRIIAISWWLFTLIIISSYTANLAAFLTVTTLSDTFKSAEELAAKTNILYGCKNPGNTCMFFNKSEIDVYKTMWNYMKRTEGAFSNSTSEGIERVKNENYAFLMESSSIQYQVNTDPDCKLTQVGPPLNSLSYGIAVRNGNPLRDMLSSTILRLNERQVLLELYNKWWKVDDNKCSLKESEGANLQLELENLEGIFVFLFGGLAVAGIVLVVEILLYAVTRSKKEKIPVCSLLVVWLKNSIKGTFPDSISNASLDRRSLSLQFNNSLNVNNNIKADIKHSTIEEEIEPLNGHTDRVHDSTTADTFISH